jgi:tRNA A58 N-methylase Trm61
MSFQEINDGNTKHQWGGYPQDFLRFIYDEVISNKATNVLEFGTGFGYVTSALAMGVRDTPRPVLPRYSSVVNTYDSYKSNQIWQIADNNLDRVKNHLNSYNLGNYVELHQVGRVFDWFDTPHKFDMCFIDIDNDGDKLSEIFNHPIIRESVENGVSIYFCGGSKVRDEINVRRNEKPITEVDCEIECVYGHTEKNCISKVIGY